MFIAVEVTPNPEALKFIPHVRLTDGRGWTFDDAAAAVSSSPLAARIFELDAVRQVYVAEDFVTVRRRPEGESWMTLRIKVVAAIADHLDSGEAAVTAAARVAGSPDPVESAIRQVLGLHVRPRVRQDGGDILFERFDPEDGVLWIRMEGACGGCPSARNTLKAGVERIVMRHVPQVSRVEETPGAEQAQDSRPVVDRWRTRLGQSGGSPWSGPAFTHRGRAFRGGGSGQSVAAGDGAGHGEEAERQQEPVQDLHRAEG